MDGDTKDHMHLIQGKHYKLSDSQVFFELDPMSIAKHLQPVAISCERFSSTL